MKRIATGLLTILGAALLSMAACQKQKQSAMPSEQEVEAARAAEAPPLIQQQWTYLNRIRQEDALSSLIDRTLMNDQHELGVVLFSNVTQAQVPGLMRTVMTEMAQEFPKKDLTLNVYRSATPLRDMGIAHLNGQTGEVKYTPAK